jgi:hypothetical protein
MILVIASSSESLLLSFLDFLVGLGRGLRRRSLPTSRDGDFLRTSAGLLFASGFGVYFMRTPLGSSGFREGDRLTERLLRLLCDLWLRLRGF